MSMRDLRRRDGDEHVDDERDRGEPRHEADEDQCPAGDLDDADERREHSGRGDADLREAPDTEGLGEEELLDALGDEDTADCKPDEEHSLGARVVTSR